MASVTELLERIDPTAIPADVQQLLRDLGPWLAGGYTYADIGAVIGVSIDAVAARVRKVQEALLAAAADG